MCANACVHMQHTFTTCGYHTCLFFCIYRFLRFGCVHYLAHRSGGGLQGFFIRLKLRITHCSHRPAGAGHLFRYRVLSWYRNAPTCTKAGCRVDT